MISPALRKPFAPAFLSWQQLRVRSLLNLYSCFAFCCVMSQHAPRKTTGRPNHSHTLIYSIDSTAPVNTHSCSMLIPAAIYLVALSQKVLFGPNSRIYQRILHLYEKWNLLPRCVLWEPVGDPVWSLIYCFYSLKKIEYIQCTYSRRHKPSKQREKIHFSNFP